MPVPIKTSNNLDRAKEAQRYGQIYYHLDSVLEQSGTTYRELARQIGIKPAVLNHTMIGRTRPTLLQVTRICHALNVTPADLLKYTRAR